MTKRFTVCSALGLFCAAVLGFLSARVIGKDVEVERLDGGPNPLHGLSVPTEGRVGLSEKIDSSGMLKGMVWLRDARIFRKALGELAAPQGMTLTGEFNWDTPLYVVFVDGQGRIVFAGKSDHGRGFFYPAKAVLKGDAVRIESVDDKKRKAKLQRGDAKEHTVYAGIEAADVIKKFEAVLAKAGKPK